MDFNLNRFIEEQDNGSTFAMCSWNQKESVKRKIQD